MGEYLVFLDADMILLDKDFIAKVRRALDEYPWISIRLIPIALGNTSIEKAQILEEYIWSKEGYIDYRHCIKKQLLAERLFNPNLGINEDRDFFEDYLKKEKGLKPRFVDTTIGARVPSSFIRFAKRWLWYGRTSMKYYWKDGTTLKGLIMALKENYRIVAPIGPILLAIIGIFINIHVTLMFLLLYLALRIRLYRKIPKSSRSLKYFTLASILSTIVRPLLFTLGFIYGMLSLLLKKRVKVSRE